MIGVTLYLLVIVTSTAGFLLFAASQEQHRKARRRLFVPDKAPVAILRAAGSLLLLISAVFAVARDGVAFGLTIWTLTITLSAFCVAVVLMLLKDHRSPSED